MSQLPAGWVFSNLRNIGLPKTLNIDPSKYPDEVFELYSVPSYSQSAPEIVKGSEIRSTKQMVQPGDVLLCKIVPHIVRVWVVPNKSNYRQIASGEWILIRPDSKQVCAEYLRYALTEPRFRAEFMNTVAGVGGSLMRARPKAVAEIPIPLPPIAEQRRIVARLDSLLAQSKAARAELNKALALAKRQRQAVLAKAFSGELTQDWREERETAFNAGNAWEETTLEALAEVGTGATPKRGNPKYYENGTIPWVTSAVVNDLVVTRAEELITQVALEETNCKVFPKGTILLAMYGEGKTRGQVTILGIEAATNQALAAIRIKPQSRILQDFVLWFLRSNYLMLRQQAAGGVQPNLNLRIIKNISVPLPSLEEQKEIVKRVEAAFAQIETMENEAKKALALAERLEQATLAKAFQGQL